MTTYVVYFLPPSPPHYDPDFKFQPRGLHDVLKHGRQIYIPPLPAPTGTNVLHFDMISLLISDAACSPFWLALVISMKRVRTFSTWQPKHAMFNSVSRTYCHVTTIFIKILLCDTLTVLGCDRMPFLQEVKGKYSVTHG